MRIKQITVKNLVGMFNHKIAMNMEDRITIIHSPNGYGKTILLKMVNALFRSRYSELRRIPFDELLVDFDNDSQLHIENKTMVDPLNLFKDSEKDKYSLILKFRNNPSKPWGKPYPVQSLTRKSVDLPTRAIERIIPELERINPRYWLYQPTNEKLSLDDIIERFEDRLSDYFPITKKPVIPPSLHNTVDSIEIRFIETQRLLSFSPRRNREYEGPLSVVNKYSEELKDAIQVKLAEYATLSQSLDRSFPTRLVTGNNLYGQVKDTELKSNLSELEEKRSRLVMAGLLDQEEGIDFKGFLKKEIDESNKNVLSVYIDDVKKKLGVFDELYRKIELIVKIINKKFLFKDLSVNKKEGFVFKAPNGKTLSPTILSSGEQHELVLLYELLFKVKPNSLILIDEPELSLHVVWQQQFLKDLQEITALGGFDVLIATHSPQIIHDRWDLTVELEGPKSEG